MPQPPDRPARTPTPSHTVGISQALANSEPLAQLARRMQESQLRLTAIATLLPVQMRPYVKAGPIDEMSWSLLATNSAVAAKLRQMLPALEAHLRVKGWDGPAIKVKLLGPT